MQQLNGDAMRYNFNNFAATNNGYHHVSPMPQYVNILGGSGYNSSNSGMTSNSIKAGKLCKYGRTCRNMNSGCTFRHDVINKPCKNAEKCPKGGACLFLHYNEELSMSGRNGNGQEQQNVSSAGSLNRIGNMFSGGQMSMFGGSFNEAGNTNGNGQMNQGSLYGSGNPFVNFQ